MKYVIEVDSPDFGVLTDAVRHEIVSAAATHRQMATRWGRGHALTIAAGQRELAAARCLKALTEAEMAAKPDPNVPDSFGPRGPSLQLAIDDDLPRSYGAPPRGSRTKASNLRRRSSGKVDLR